MVADDLLLVARRRAGLTQRELAQRLGRPQSTIGRWETGARSPSFADVVDALAACGFELSPELLTRDLSLLSDARGRLELQPLERLNRLGGSEEVQDVLKRVAAARPRCVVVGEVAGALQGWPLRLPHNVLELVCENHDQDRLGATLSDIGAKPGTAQPRQPGWDADNVVRWELPGGAAVEILNEPAGTSGYRDLATHADHLSIAETPQRVASVVDLIRTADASHASGGRFFLPALYAVLDARRLGANRVLAHGSPQGRAAHNAWLSAQRR